MSYKNLKNRLNFLETTIEIDNEDEYIKYSNMLKNKETLPTGITYVTTYDQIGNQRYVFYREATDEEIKTIIEISNAKSLKRAGDSLHFFKVLVIVMILTSVGISLLLLFLSIL